MTPHLTEVEDDGAVAERRLGLIEEDVLLHHIGKLWVAAVTEPAMVQGSSQNWAKAREHQRPLPPPLGAPGKLDPTTKNKACHCQSQSLSGRDLSA